MKKIQKMRRMIQRKFREGIAILKDNSGLSVIEMLLILVVIIALILIFKNQLIDLVNMILIRSQAKVQAFRKENEE